MAADRNTITNVKYAWRGLTKLKESNTQKIIEKEISIITNGRAPIFRINVGTGWIGNKVIHTDDGGVYIQNARPFNTGVKPGFSDLFCVVPVFITPEMVGQTIGTAVFIEVKTLTGKAREEQEKFLALMRARGCRAGIARQAEDVEKLLMGGIY